MEMQNKISKGQQAIEDEASLIISFLNLLCLHDKGDFAVSRETKKSKMLFSLVPAMNLRARKYRP